MYHVLVFIFYGWNCLYATELANLGLRGARYFTVHLVSDVLMHVLCDLHGGRANNSTVRSSVVVIGLIR